jgi:hypothetical protein
VQILLDHWCAPSGNKFNRPKKLFPLKPKALFEPEAHSYGTHSTAEFFPHNTNADPAGEQSALLPFAHAL